MTQRYTHSKHDQRERGLLDALRGARRTALGLIAAVSMFPATAVTALASHTHLPESTQALPPVKFGAYVPNGAQDAGLLDEFDARMGTTSAIVHWYQPWGFDAQGYGSALDTDALRNVAARRSTPLLTWEAWGLVEGRDPSRLASIPTGAFDAYIDSWAHGLRAFGQPVYLRLFHEMNNPRYPWAAGQNGNTPADLVRAWRYVHDRFTRAGATNVLWVWSPNTENDLVSFASLYPGDDVVDWLAVDGYNGGGQLDWGGWRRPTELFERSLASLGRLSPGKPIMIAETSSVERGGSKSAWIEDLFIALPAACPAVRAIVWFQADLTHRGEADWRLDTSEEALAAVRQTMRRSPAFPPEPRSP